MGVPPATAPTAVVGHVEWVTHARGRLPVPGGISDLREPITEAAGGGGVAAAAIARAADPVLLFTAIGTGPAADAARRALERPGLEVHAAPRPHAQTPVLSVTHPDGDRTIMVVGERLQPRAVDVLPWHRLAGCASCYYAGEDPDALVHARQAAVLVVTARRAHDVRAAGVTPDVLVASAADPHEDPSAVPSALAPEWTVITDGARGGIVRSRRGGEWAYAAQAPPGPVVDTYGCGDTFAGCLAAFLGRGQSIDQAIAHAAREAARCTTWRGGPGPAA